MAGLSKVNPQGDAARQYWEAVQRLNQCETVVDERAKHRDFIMRAVKNETLKNFRGIATALTKSIGPTYQTTKSCRPEEHVDVDHAIPLCLIHQMILKISGLEDIEMLLRRHMIGVRLTLSEHKRLNKKYKMSMPDNWNWDSGCPLARYKAVSIDVVPIDPQRKPVLYLP